MTYRVRNITCGGVAVGSSFAIASHLLVTNRHVVLGADVLELDSYQGDAIRVTVAARGYYEDLAVIATEQTLPVTATLASADPAIGTTVTAVGYPRGGQLTSTSGSVLGYIPDPLRENTYGRVISTNVDVTHGNSGGPLVDDGGSVVGVIYGGNEHGTNYALPVSALRKLLSHPRSALGAVDAC